MQVSVKDIPVGGFFKYNGEKYKRIMFRGKNLVLAEDSGLLCVVAQKLYDNDVTLFMQDNSVQSIDNYPKCITSRDMKIGDVVETMSYPAPFNSGIVTLINDNQVGIERPYMQTNSLNAPLIGVERYTTKRNTETKWLLLTNYHF